MSNLNPQQFDPEHGKQFGSLTYQGQLYYADRRQEGDDHEKAFRDARYSYGVKKS